MQYNNKKVSLFIILTFSICWLMAVLFAVFGGKLHTTSGLIMAILYMFVPMTVTILIQKLAYKEPLKEPLDISFKLNGWFLLAWILPVFISFAAFGIALLLPGVHFSPQMEGLVEMFQSQLTPDKMEALKKQLESPPIFILPAMLLQALVAGTAVNAIAAFGEELGWRGFLQKELSGLGFWKSSLAIGVIWGIWHAPLIALGHNYPNHPVAGVFMMVVFCTLLGPIISYVRLKAKSVIAAAIMHGMINASPGFALMYLRGGNELLIGITGLAGFIIMLIINIIIFAFDRSLLKEP